MRRIGDFGASTSRAEALSRVAKDFWRSGIDQPDREARLTVCVACALRPVDLIVAPEEPLGATAARLRDFAMRRASGEPLSKIVGSREFWGLAFTISADVLDPRPETETIVEAALKVFADRRDDPLRVLDLGVGSGALLCALLHEFSNAHGVGVDISAAAAKAAHENVDACGLTGRAQVRLGYWTDDLEGPFDLIVSNPPYIRSADIEKLSREVRGFDPRLALDGGPDGLDAFRAIIPATAPLIAAGGWFITEVGAGQAPEVLVFANKAGFRGCETHRDLGGVERAVAARSPRAVPGKSKSSQGRLR